MHRNYHSFQNITPTLFFISLHIFYESRVGVGLKNYLGFLQFYAVNDIQYGENCTNSSDVQGSVIHLKFNMVKDRTGR